MDISPFEEIKTSVKVVIWDLDESFWSGTLSEGGISPRPEHINMVKMLADRGIMSSICSKNDFAAAQAELEKLGVWEYFIFPHIDWTSKGQAIKAQIEAMQLRPENVMFIDDNQMNLEEARYFCPGIICVDGQADLRDLPKRHELRGKDDKDHSRLKQYKFMEAKQSEQKTEGISNEEFIRQSEIKIQFIWDLESNWDRMIELINRTNQLNFTKKRVESEKDLEAFRALLASPATHAGLVRVTDRFGDYGIVGFFLMQRRSSGSRLVHFVFSCRTLHMGIEQWLYEKLDKPTIIYEGHTANGLEDLERVDWIEEVEDLVLMPEEARGRKLCLVGGCDLMQMTFYCGAERSEFVNIMRNDQLVRFDEFGFFLNARDDRSYDLFPTRMEMPTRKEMKAYDKAISESDLVILSLFHAVAGDQHYRFGPDYKFITMPPNQTLRHVLQSKFGVWYTKNFVYDALTLEDRRWLCREAIESALAKAPQRSTMVLISASEKGEKAEKSIEARRAYNALIQQLAKQHGNIVVLDVDAILDDEDFFDSDHYLRPGYYKMAKFINNLEIGPDDQSYPAPEPAHPEPVVTLVSDRTETPPDQSNPEPAPAPVVTTQRNRFMVRILDSLYVNDPYLDAPLEDIAVDMQGWASNHFLFRGIMEIVMPRTVIEVGTWKGMSAMHMADIAKEKGIEGFEICCVDTWLGAPGLWNTPEFAQDMLKLKNGWPQLYFTFMKNVIERNHQDVITPLPMPADMACHVLKKKRVMAEMIYVDAAHDYENCKRDIESYWPLLTQDGVMLGDDYDERHPGVVKAAHEFSQENNACIATTKGKFALSRVQEKIDAVNGVIEEVDKRRALSLEKRKAREAAAAAAQGTNDAG